VVLWFKVGNVQFVSVPDAGVPRAGVVNVGEVKVLLVRVCVAVSVTTVSEDPGKVIVVLSVPAKVKELLAVKVLVEATLRPVTVAEFPVQLPDDPAVF